MEIGSSANRVFHSVLATGAVAIVAFLAAPADSLWRYLAWFVPPVLAAGMLVVRAKRAVPSPLRGALRLMAVGQCAYVLVTIAWLLGSLGVGFDRTIPSLVDAGYFVVYGTYAAFLIALLRRSLGGRRIQKRIAVIDSAVLVMSAAAMLWVTVVEPQLATDRPALTTSVALLYPVVCLVLFGLAVCITLSVRVLHVPTGLLLWVWTGAATVGGAFYGVQSADAGFEHGQAFTVIWMVSNTALAGLAAHPRTSRIVRWHGADRPAAGGGRAQAPGVGRNVRLGVVLVASLITLGLHEAYDDRDGGHVMLLVSGAMFCLVTYRTALLAGDLSAQSRVTAQLDQAVEELRRQRDDLARYAAIVDSTDDCIVAVDANGVIVDWNQGAQRMLGHRPEEAIGQHITLIAMPQDAEDYARSTELVAERGHISLEGRHMHRDGMPVEVSVTLSRLNDDAGQIRGFVGISRDISDRKAREAERHQDSKLESLGRLSAGLAHEINTPIQFVGDNTRFLAEAYQDLIRVVRFYRELLDSQDPLSWDERLERMRGAEAAIEFDYLQEEIPSAVAQTLEGIERVSTIVRAMKTFSHPGRKEQVPANLNEALTATITVANHQVKSVADLMVELGDLPPVMCNIADLNQVFLNLIVNAADAIEETGRHGAITVITSVEDSDAVIRITDTGGGIPEDVGLKIFDPFFTTKAVGHGTGQGLAHARVVVHEGHGGAITADSTMGLGTTFTVRLPIKGRATAVPEAAADLSPAMV
jgi:two-component system NtrC family sensor kinase